MNAMAPVVKELKRAYDVTLKGKMNLPLKQMTLNMRVNCHTLQKSHSLTGLKPVRAV